MTEKPFRRSQIFLAGFYGAVLVYINLHIARNFFHVLSAPMNSMHGYWAGIAERAHGAWFQSQWWPYADGGIPFEFTYAPGIPLASALVAWLRHVSPLMAFNNVAGCVYVLAPLTLFLGAWLLTRAPGYAFIAAFVYSLTSTTQLIAPDADFHWRAFWDARRLYLTGAWDDTPHLAAIAMLPLIVLFLSLAIRQRRPVWYALSALSIALATWCSSFGPIDTALAALCLLFVLRRQSIGFNVLLVCAIGFWAWAMTAPYQSPAIIAAVQRSSKTDGTGWQESSWTALALVIFGWAVLWRYLPRWTSDWRVQFFALLTYLFSAIVVIAEYMHREFLPQPTRYKLEMELALDLLIVFALKPLIDRFPKSVRFGLLAIVLAFGGEQVTSDAAFGRAIMQPADLSRTIEWRASTWAAAKLPGVRVALPGSISQWANLFSPVLQFGGGAWSVAYNESQQRASWGTQNISDDRNIEVRYAMAWLRAFGVGAIGVAGPKSPEFWKTMRHPDKFEGILPVLWREDDTTIYQVPRRSASFAHVVPRESLVVNTPLAPSDIWQVERYVKATEDTALPQATFRWEDNNHFVIGAPADSGHVISIQVSGGPGWHASARGRKVPVSKDGIGLMWVDPKCAGGCEVEMSYDGGWQLRLLRWLSFAALAAVILTPLWLKRSKEIQDVLPIGIGK